MRAIIWPVVSPGPAAGSPGSRPPSVLKPPPPDLLLAEVLAQVRTRSASFSSACRIWSHICWHRWQLCESIGLYVAVVSIVDFPWLRVSRVVDRTYTTGNPSRFDARFLQ
jgi:hypothetical protein